MEIWWSFHCGGRVRGTCRTEIALWKMSENKSYNYTVLVCSASHHQRESTQLRSPRPLPLVVTPPPKKLPRPFYLDLDLSCRDNFNTHLFRDDDDETFPRGVEITTYRKSPFHQRGARGPIRRRVKRWPRISSRVRENLCPNGGRRSLGPTKMQRDDLCVVSNKPFDANCQTRIGKRPPRITRRYPTTNPLPTPTQTPTMKVRDRNQNYHSLRHPYTPIPPSTPTSCSHAD